MKISVVIPTKNRFLSLRAVLDSLLDQIFSDDLQLEVIIVDNGSWDGTKELLNDYRHYFGQSLVYLYHADPGASRARNLGIKASTGDIVACIDDDAVAEKNWIQTMADFFKGHPDAAAVGGKILAQYPPDASRWVLRNDDFFCGPVIFHDYGDKVRPYDETMFPLINANAAFRRNIFDEIGFFPEDLGAGTGRTGDDTEMFWMLVRSGKKVYYNGQMVVLHPVERERLKWPHIRRWLIAQGRHHALVKIKAGMMVKNERCWAGIPFDMFRLIAIKIFHMPWEFLSDEKKFLQTLRLFIVYIGICQECRYFYRTQTVRKT